ncbi:MAG: flagellar basal body rod protein FlgF [Steroidobacteraceae bacterium]
MDKLLYIAMSGAKESLRAQTAVSHNLANATTTAFKADLNAFMARDIAGPGYHSRAYATTSTTGWNLDAGALEATGRDLDVAINGSGWIAVQAQDGSEAYTRAGDLRIQASGLLTNGAGHVILGDGGPITIPPSSSLLIGRDGTISAVALGQSPQSAAPVARIKLVDPPPDTLQRGADGLFRMRDGSTAEASASVAVSSGALETSNVNTAQALVDMIEISRRYDLQVRMIRNAEENATSSARLLQMG